MSSRRSRQRGDIQRIHGEPVEEIGPEAAGSHFLLEISIGGGDHAHVDPMSAVISDTLDLSFLQNTQELRL